jgi:hypothetical protein
MSTTSRGEDKDSTDINFRFLGLEMGWMDPFRQQVSIVF